MTTRSAIKTLLLSVLGLPLILVVLAWVNNLLSAMGDTSAVLAVGYVSTITRILWLVALVGLIVTLALQSLEETDQDSPDQMSPDQV